MTVLHMGALHSIEIVLTLLLAFGPFLVLAVVIYLRRKPAGSDGRDDDPADVDAP